MSKFSDHLEAALLNATLRNSAYSSPATVFVALHSADPTDDGSGAELSGNGYARQSAAWDAPSAGACQNSATLTFSASGGAWLQATHFAIWDAVSGGNLLYHAPLDTPRTAQDGDDLEFAAAAITVTLA